MVLYVYIHKDIPKICKDKKHCSNLYITVLSENTEGINNIFIKNMSLFYFMYACLNVCMCTACVPEEVGE